MGEKAEVQQLLAAVNNRTPFGYLGIDADARIFYRYVLCVPRSEHPRMEIVLEVMELMQHTLSYFGELIIEVYGGQRTVEEVIGGL